MCTKVKKLKRIYVGVLRRCQLVRYYVDIHAIHRVSCSFCCLNEPHLFFLLAFSALMCGATQQKPFGKVKGGRKNWATRIQFLWLLGFTLRCNCTWIGKTNLPILLQIKCKCNCNKLGWPIKLSWPFCPTIGHNWRVQWNNSLNQLQHPLPVVRKWRISWKTTLNSKCVLLAYR